jgi:hypothetical protein
VTSKNFQQGLRPDNPYAGTEVPELGLEAVGASYLIGDGLNYKVDITGNLSHIADLEPSLGLMAHQDIAEDELVIVLHKQPPTLYGWQDMVQVEAGTDLVLFKYQDIVVNHKGWGVEERWLGQAWLPDFCSLSFLIWTFGF